MTRGWGVPSPSPLNSAGSNIRLNEEQNPEGPLTAGPAETTTAAAAAVDVPLVAGMATCPECGRQFKNVRGLGVHRQRAHPEEYNRGIQVPHKVRWSDEELRLLARVEAQATVDGVRFLNLFLVERFPHRSLEAIKGVRRKPAYRDFVQVFLLELNGPESPEAVPVAVDQVSPVVAAAPPEVSFRGCIADLMAEVVVPGEGFRTDLLRQVATSALGGADAGAELMEWLALCFPPVGSGEVEPVAAPRFGTRPFSTCSPRKPSRRTLRRRAYARIQSLWRRDRCRAASEVLDGAPKRGSHSLADITQFWSPMLSRESAPMGLDPICPCCPEGDGLWFPVSVKEVEDVVVPLRSAAGPDGITPRVWRAVPAVVRALVFNVLMVLGRAPAELLVSRTIFIPKSECPASPEEYRPISIASVVLRQFHKILARRLQGLGLLDERQRASVTADGTAENISILDSILWTARSTLREVHVVTVDVTKAFDCLSHDAIISILVARGFPAPFVNYLAAGYGDSTTRFKVGRDLSDPIQMGRGVRQGDPLSPLIFNLAMDEVMARVPSDVGFLLPGCRVACLGFADDLVLVTSTAVGMRTSLSAVEVAVGGMGLALNASKCRALSMIPDGKRKRMKVLEDPGFIVGLAPITPVSAVSSFRYLGVDFAHAGTRSVEVDLSEALSRISSAPLKPQQRLVLARSFLLPRFSHTLVLGSVSLGRLIQLDRQIRRSVRSWLRLPRDVSVAYFHAPTRSGGLGIPSLRTSIPALTLQRLGRLSSSPYSAARAAAASSRVIRKLAWASKASVCVPRGTRDFWSSSLYSSVDGYELRESAKCPASSAWIARGGGGIPGRDFVQYVHTHINSLPTRVRLARGDRERDKLCRAGCGFQETAAHAIQNCFRTHGGRIKRHDAVVKVVANSLRQAAWEVIVEPHVTLAVGLRKPDLVARREDRVLVLDAQVVSGAVPLNLLHRNKLGYYASIPGFSQAVLEKFGWPLLERPVEYSSVTLSWRGVWSPRSYSDLLSFGIPPGALCGLTTQVLQGSHTNWTRFNCLTTTRH